MDYRARIKFLFRLAGYRQRLFFFMVLGIAMFLASFLVLDPYGKDIVAQFAVVFMAVGLIDFVWDFLGGTPIELQMTRALSDIDAKLDSVHGSVKVLSDIELQMTRDFGEVDSKLDSIHRSMTVLSDIVDGNIGIERIWPNRGVWELASVDGLAAWKERVCGAASVDMVSNTLYTRWFHGGAFRNELFGNLARGHTVHILIYDPLSEVSRLRAYHEQGVEGEMHSEIWSTLVSIARDRETLDDAAQRNLQVRLTTTFYHLAQIIRADDKMLITNYLAGKSGTPSPTFQLRGPDTEYFRTYQQQIETFWQGGREVNDDEFRQILAQGQIQPRK